MAGLPHHRDLPEGSSLCLPCQEGCAFCKDDTPCVAQGDGVLRMAILSFQGLCMLVDFISMVLLYHFRRSKVSTLCRKENSLRRQMFPYHTSCSHWDWGIPCRVTLLFVLWVYLWPCLCDNISLLIASHDIIKLIQPVALCTPELNTELCLC